MTAAMTRDEIFSVLGLREVNPGAFAGGWLSATGGELTVESPTTAESIGAVQRASAYDYEAVVTSAQETFAAWRMLPAPKRGDYVRQIGNALRDNKRALGGLVALEMGKILAEGEGEVQEMIDITDFAVGLSRQLYGSTMASERPRHRMYEHWHPLGPVGIITAFNFPVAVWSWNAFIAAVCGDTMVWKPSSQAPLTAIAVTRICYEVMAGSGFEGVFNLAVGRGAEIGDRMINDRRFPADLGDRILRNGRKGRHGRRQAAGALPPRAGGQQCRSGPRRRQRRIGDKSNPLWSRRHVRATLYDGAPDDLRIRHPRRCDQATRRRVPTGPSR